MITVSTQPSIRIDNSDFLLRGGERTKREGVWLALNFRSLALAFSRCMEGVLFFPSSSLYGCQGRDFLDLSGRPRQARFKLQFLILRSYRLNKQTVYCRECFYCCLEVMWKIATDGWCLLMYMPLHRTTDEATVPVACPCATCSLRPHKPLYSLILISTMTYPSKKKKTPP